MKIIFNKDNYTADIPYDLNNFLEMCEQINDFYNYSPYLSYYTFKFVGKNNFTQEFSNEKEFKTILEYMSKNPCSYNKIFINKKYGNELEKKNLELEKNIKVIIDDK